jgi:hypothetical protein
MILKRVLAFFWMVFVFILLGTTTVAGSFDVYDNIPLVDTSLRKLTLVFQMVYTASGAVALIALLTKRPWFVPALGTWAVAVTITATLAPTAWGDTGIGPGLAAGAATALVSGLILWWTFRIVSRTFPVRPRGG